MPLDLTDPKVASLADKVSAHIHKQITNNEDALRALEPQSAGWYRRTQETANSIIPDLVKHAPDLIDKVSRNLNSPKLIRKNWKTIKEHIIESDLPEKIGAATIALDEGLDYDEQLTKVSGGSVSSLISDFWLSVRSDLKTNGSSNYPDMFLDGNGYKMLPKRSKQNVHVPAVRGGKPVNVPDGIEIKSQRGKTIRVDAHHAHRGLHIALTFDYDEDTKEGRVYDLYVAYLSEHDYTQSGESTSATTRKFSFKHERFISVTTGETKEPVPVEDSDLLPGCAEALEATEGVSAVDPAGKKSSRKNKNRVK